jgi:hypothetical protein
MSSIVYSLAEASREVAALCNINGIDPQTEIR